MQSRVEKNLGFKERFLGFGFLKVFKGFWGLKILRFSYENRARKYDPKANGPSKYRILLKTNLQLAEKNTM